MTQTDYEAWNMYFDLVLPAMASQPGMPVQDIIQKSSEIADAAVDKTKAKHATTKKED